jgi:CelD/BcsL family acetyltransferase involved in cellulose biosynthesis
LRIVLHRSIPEDELLRRQWNALVEQMERPEVFYTYEWALAVHRAYGAEMVPWLLLAYEEDRLLGVVALAITNSQEAVFLAGTTADYCDFICPWPRRPEFLAAVFARLRAQNVKTLRLANLPADSSTARALETSARNSGYSMFSRFAYSCAQVALDVPGNRNAAKASVQRRMRRYSKTLGKQGPVRFHHATSFGEIAAELPAFTRAHVARFLATGRISNLARPERRVFLEELARSLSDSGWVTLSRLMVGGRAVAWNYGFQFAGSWFWYQPTFASDFQRYSPGLWLLSKIVEESCEKADSSRIDLGLGAEGYKDRLATGSRQTLHVTVMRSPSGCWKERVRYRSAVAIRSVPRLEGWVRTGMRHGSLLRERFQAGGLAGCLQRFSRRLQKLVRDESEFLLLNWSEGEYFRLRNSPLPSAAIHPVNLDWLATAAMHYGEDPDALAYLLRAAERLRQEQSRGVVLVNSEGLPVHFCWITGWERLSRAESSLALKSGSSNSALLVDAWTPTAVRGRGYYREAIAGVALQLQTEGASAWILPLATNGAALRGAERAGFVPISSVRHKRVLFARKMIESELSRPVRPGAEVSSAA